MDFLLTFAKTLFPILLLVSIVGIVISIKKFGFKSRLNAAKAVGVNIPILFCATVALATTSQKSSEDNLAANLLNNEFSVFEDSPVLGAPIKVATKDETWKQKALEEVRKENSVVEALFPENANSSFWASMRDDGTKRDGFAQYLCIVLRDSGMPFDEFVVIRIWDAYRLANDELHEIGRSECRGR